MRTFRVKRGKHHLKVNGEIKRLTPGCMVETEDDLVAKYGKDQFEEVVTRAPAEITYVPSDLETKVPDVVEVVTEAPPAGAETEKPPESQGQKERQPEYQKVNSPLGDDITNLFAQAEKADVKVFRQGEDEHYVTDADSVDKPLHEGGTLTKKQVVRFIKEQLKN